MTLAAVPAFGVTADRLHKLQELLAQVQDSDLEELIEYLTLANVAQARQELRAALAILADIDSRRDVTGIYPGRSYPLWVSGGLSGGDDATEAMRLMTALRLVERIDQQLRLWADEDWAAEERAHGHERRWVLYDVDADRLATTNAHGSYQDAADDADLLHDVIVVRLAIGIPTTDDDEPTDDGEPAE
ncbi:MAG TPA: hypothetical protein VMP01_02090 [Pirellulaceae bacterium]|nr:hypothetical protein [Pirellulaceae bacterium]